MGWEAKLRDLMQLHGIVHFSPRELAQVGRRGRLQPPPHNLLGNIIPTLHVAEHFIRSAVNSPVYVLSGYRDPAYNRLVGGAPHSLHVEFNALDLRCDVASPQELYDIACRHPLAHKMGIGLYSTFIHIDTRGFIGRAAPARW